MGDAPATGGYWGVLLGGRVGGQWVWEGRVWLGRGWVGAAGGGGAASPAEAGGRGGGLVAKLGRGV